MKHTPKLRGGSDSELTKLKALWRDSLSDLVRSAWRSRFASTDTQAAIRAEMKTKLKINLSFDSQLTNFRQWVEEQDAMDAEAERQTEEETRLREQHPDWDADRLRTEVINGSLRRALATGDFKGLGLKAVRADQAERTGKFQAELETEKLKLAKQAEERAQQEFKLAREKFEFDAAQAALKHAAELKTISTSKLSEPEKVNRARQRLFGILPS